MKFARIDAHRHGTPGDVIEVYPNEVAECVRKQLQSDLNPGEKLALLRVEPHKPPGPAKGKCKFLHFLVYRP